MKLITEVNRDLKLIKEDKENGGGCYIEGVFMQGNIKNRNGRIYPSKVLNEKVQTYIKEKVETDQAIGELGHPDGPSINLDRVSHKIESLWLEGDNWMGRAKLLDTPMGKIAQNLVEGGVQIGVSSRGLGSIKQKQGVNEVQDDFHLVTAADIVADPSAPDAYVNGIMESAEWVYEGGIYVKVQTDLQKEQFVEETQEEIEKIVEETKGDKEARNAAYLKLFEDLVAKVSKS